MTRNSLEPRVAVLEEKNDSLESRTSVLETDMKEIRTTLGELRVETRDGLQQVRNDVNTGLGVVIKGALDSMPKWAAAQIRTSAVLVGVSGTLILALITVILWLASH